MLVLNIFDKFGAERLWEVLEAKYKLTCYLLWDFLAKSGAVDCFDFE